MNTNEELLAALNEKLDALSANPPVPLLAPFADEDALDVAHIPNDEAVADLREELEEASWLKSNPHAAPWRRSAGKVARLPLEIRNLVNRALRDGRTYREIAALLQAHGHPGFNYMNISRWQRSGYREWLESQQAFEAANPISPAAAAALGQVTPGASTDVLSLNERLLDNLFSGILQSIDPKTVQAWLAQDPARFLQFSQRFTALLAARARRAETEIKRAQEDRQRQSSNAAPRPLLRTVEELVTRLAREGLDDLADEEDDDSRAKPNNPAHPPSIL